MQTGAGGGVGRGGVASETATISNFISHIFTAIRWVGGGAKGGCAWQPKPSKQIYIVNL